MPDDDKVDVTTGPLTDPGTEVDATDKTPENVPSTTGGEQIGSAKLGAQRDAQVRVAEQAALTSKPTAQMKGLLR